MTPDIPFNRSAVRAGDCFSIAVDAVQSRYWLFLGITFLGLIIGGCLPLVSIFLYGPITVGIYLVLLRQMRGQSISLDMMFKGFERFVPAMIVGIIQMLPEIIGQGIRLMANFAELAAEVSGRRYFYGPSSSDFALSGTILAVIIVFVLAALAFGLAWRITFFFALPLITEYDLGIGDAIKLSARAGWANAGGLILLQILQFLLVLLGMLLLCVGIFFVLPFVYGTSAAAFRQVFPDNPNTFFHEPPQPGVYGRTYGRAG